MHQAMRRVEWSRERAGEGSLGNPFCKLVLGIVPPQTLFLMTEIC